MFAYDAGTIWNVLISGNYKLFYSNSNRQWEIEHIFFHMLHSAALQTHCFTNYDALDYIVADAFWMNINIK